MSRGCFNQQHATSVRSSFKRRRIINWTGPIPQAKTIIRKLERLLQKQGLSREAWLKEWGRLRLVLSETTEYKMFRLEVITRASNMCQFCFEKRGAEVHHIVRVVDNPSLALDPNNGAFLCKKCHKKEH